MSLNVILVCRIILTFLLVKHVGGFLELKLGYMHGGFATGTYLDQNGAAQQMAIEEARAEGFMTGWDVSNVGGLLKLKLGYMHGGYEYGTYLIHNGAAAQMAIDQAREDGYMDGWNIKTMQLGYMYGGFDDITRYEANGAAAQLALERGRAEGWMNGWDIRLLYRDDKCTPKLMVAEGMALIEQHDVDGFVGLTCSVAVRELATFATYLNLPLFPCASTDIVFDDKETYSTIVRVMPSFNKFGIALHDLIEMFGWKRFILVAKYGIVCDIATRTFTKMAADAGWLIVDWLRFVELDMDVWDSHLVLINQTARIVFLCGTEGDVDRMLVRADEQGMGAPHFLYIVSQFSPISPENPSLTNATTPESRRVQRAASSSIQFSLHGVYGENATRFLNRHTARIQGPPWNITPPPVGSSILTVYLHDSVMMYIRAVNRTLEQGLDPRNGSHLFKVATQIDFHGQSGPVRLSAQADRLPHYKLSSAREGWNDSLHFGEIITSLPHGQRVVITDARMWDIYGGSPPLDTPLCGYFGEFCQVDDAEVPVVEITVSVVTFLLLLSATTFLLHRRRQAKLSLQLMNWRIKSEDLTFQQGVALQRSAVSLRMSVSRASFMSSATNASRVHNYTTVALYVGQKVAVKHALTPTLRLLHLTRTELVELKTIRDLRHDNVNPFIGLCVQPTDVWVVSAYCQKGSLQDILTSEEITLDDIFRDSLIHDLLSAIKYIHGSAIRSHGNLKSSNCLVDGRWVLRVGDLDPSCVVRGGAEEAELEDRYRGMLWTAPELLRKKERPTRGSQPADIYAFSIILQEISSFSNAFFLNESGNSAKDTIEWVKSARPGCRPAIAGREDIPSDYHHMMGECWEEAPEDRPRVDMVIRMMNDANRKRKNLADVVMMKLEKYAHNLESVVSKRTGELTAKKKETENLLHQMLPKSIAEELIAGGAMYPQTYDECTVYFSDVTNFVELCTNTTPLSGITLLNDLYELMDDCVAKFPVYKVETIRDTYMVSSGVPSPDPSHAAHVADMAIALLDLALHFKVKDGDGKLELRIGIHSGGCCAGVVGMAMPRYCLFGDTVNTASRMCSHGKPLRIHMSEPTYTRIDPTGEYHILRRGHINVKGKGEMCTYWLQGKNE